ncbi:primosomal replication protein N [Shewanella sp. WXL01]|uniref:Primosomal replication protein N n=1 Tax=Shewanella maritima TaxID=2520507 RepID=A0A411PMR9_9GAMM|nr:MULTISPECIES: primosomal replication protein N [Shewanella]NKF49462.1 primosomal replication protein N [Shewanella sp. WXL01]QBF84815.1 primosomal replication protein N [Shewanella maritima]
MLSGEIKRARQFESPSGIAHTVLTLEHRSRRLDADLPRNVYCLIQVILSGERLNSATDKFKAGMQVDVEGYLSLQQGRNGQNRLVLHAENVELKT